MNSCFPAGQTSVPAISCRLKALLNRQPSPALPPVILCIGTDRVIGDCLGPLIGANLQKARLLPYVYGTLEAPVHALNLTETLRKIKEKHPHNTLIAVDASLGYKTHIGSVTVRGCGLRPGAGVCKSLSAAGDISITGVTGTEDGCPWLALQTARLSTIVSMADCITECILNAAAAKP